MDFMQLLASAGITTTGVAMLLLVYRVVKSIQGKKLISSCCGKKMEMGFTVSDMTPIVIEVKNPMLPPPPLVTDKVESTI